MRWGASTRRSTKEMCKGEWTTGPLSAVNNSSRLAALMELKVKIQMEPESDFLLQHSRKLYSQECYCWLQITSQVLYARESFCLHALLAVHHAHHHHPSQ